MEEINEPTMAEESISIRHIVNAFDYILNVEKKRVEAPPQSKAPTKKQNGQYSLRS